MRAFAGRLRDDDSPNAQTIDPAGRQRPCQETQKGLGAVNDRSLYSFRKSSRSHALRDHRSISSATLGFIECRVRSLEQGMDVRHVRICLGNPKAYREVYALSLDSGVYRIDPA